MVKDASMKVGNTLFAYMKKITPEDYREQIQREAKKHAMEREEIKDAMERERLEKLLEQREKAKLRQRKHRALVVGQEKMRGIRDSRGRKRKVCATHEVVNII
jgi:hypothetical protein